MAFSLEPRFAFDGTRMPDHTSTPTERLDWLDRSINLLRASSYESSCWDGPNPIPAYFWSDHNMQSLFDTWQFTRDRLKPAYQDLTEEQLLWRPHDQAHSIGELLYHM